MGKAPKIEQTFSMSDVRAEDIIRVRVGDICLDENVMVRPPSKTGGPARMAREIQNFGALDPVKGWYPILLGQPTNDIHPLGGTWTMPEGKFYIVNDGCQRLTGATTIGITQAQADLDGLEVGESFAERAKAGKPTPRYAPDDTIPCIVHRGTLAHLMCDIAAVANKRPLTVPETGEAQRRRYLLSRARHPGWTLRQHEEYLGVSQSAVRNYQQSQDVIDICPETANPDIGHDMRQAVYKALVSRSSRAEAPSLIAPLIAQWRKSGQSPQALSAFLKQLADPQLTVVRANELHQRIQDGSAFTVPDTRGRDEPSAEAAAENAAKAETETAQNPSAESQAPGASADAKARGEVYGFIRFGAKTMEHHSASEVGRFLADDDIGRAEIFPALESLRAWCEHVESVTITILRQREQNAREPEPEPEPTDADIESVARAAEAALAVA